MWKEFLEEGKSLVMEYSTCGICFALDKGIEEKNLHFALCTQTQNVLRTYTATEQIIPFH